MRRPVWLKSPGMYHSPAVRRPAAPFRVVGAGRAHGRRAAPVRRARGGVRMSIVPRVGAVPAHGPHARGRAASSGHVRRRTGWGGWLPFRSAAARADGDSPRAAGGAPARPRRRRPAPAAGLRPCRPGRRPARGHRRAGQRRERSPCPAGFERGARLPTKPRAVPARPDKPSRYRIARAATCREAGGWGRAGTSDRHRSVGIYTRAQRDVAWTVATRHIAPLRTGRIPCAERDLNVCWPPLKPG
jgi:hypothetical protein